MARFTRTDPAPVVKGGYGAFREYVRADFERYCAYCSLHESHARGPKNFQIDHFCPQNKCKDLVGDFYNLYWACNVCNGFQGKSGRWPSAALIARGIGFVDLCKDTFEDHYEIEADGRLKPLTLSAKYTIDAIDLNEEFLIEYRAEMLRLNEPFGRKP